MDKWYLLLQSDSAGRKVDGSGNFRLLAMRLMSRDRCGGRMDTGTTNSQAIVNTMVSCRNLTTINNKI
jgi:hypothetical protein